MSFNELPPTPPTFEEEEETYIQRDSLNIGDGSFDFVNDISIRYMLQNAFNALQRCEGWAFVKKDPGNTGFMFSKDPMIYIIMESMEKCKPSVGHSGASYALTLREMALLANIGIESYKTRYT